MHQCITTASEGVGVLPIILLLPVTLIEYLFVTDQVTVRLAGG
jgi:hypothetical protein